MIENYCNDHMRSCMITVDKCYNLLVLCVCSVVMPTRDLSRKVLARGFFPDAEVVRGHDWLWGDQDGKEINNPNAFLCLSLVCC